ncbi:MAG: TIGR04086 family membrane protein [Clostridiales bacterium]|nr:TIGR04086 family membrane protein [Clostridiales bacterium]
MRKNVKNVDDVMGTTLISNIIIVIRSSIVAIILTLLLFIIFSIVMKVGNLTEDVIPPISQVIRVTSIAFSGALAARSSKSKGWLKGALTGITYMLWAYIISLLFGNKISLDSIAISDIGMGFIVGAIGGIIGINLK